MIREFKTWLRKHKISYERAAYALEWDLDRLVSILSLEETLSLTEMKDIEVYTFWDVKI